MRTLKTFTLIAGCLLLAPAATSAQQGRATDRLAGMDRNGDGVVTRQEWTGPADGFDARDWNSDGVLSGSELQPGARRGQARRAREAGRDAGSEPFDDWTAGGFTALDRNRDGRISESEWPSDFAGFDRADHNSDGTISRAEFLNEDVASPGDTVSSMDANRDGQLTRREWRGSSEEFTRRDGNRDGLLSGTELNNIGGSRAQGPFGPASQRRSRAYQAGYELGRTEGLEAGRQDRERRQGWDLEGQRELETADSGYNPAIGPRAEYQSGYRDAFRAAYAEGYGKR